MALLTLLTFCVRVFALRMKCHHYWLAMWKYHGIACWKQTECSSPTSSFHYLWKRVGAKWERPMWVRTLAVSKHSPILFRSDWWTAYADTWTLLIQKSKVSTTKTTLGSCPAYWPLTDFDPNKVKKELSEVEKNQDKTKLAEENPPAKRFVKAKINPASFLPDLEKDEVEVTSFTPAVKEWYAANEKKK